jgi:DNA invertase Pin-like site-specific DNA recombinase
VAVLTHGLVALLARNGRDWHALLEFCGLIRTLIIDVDGIYDPRQPNDRLLGCGSSFLIGRKN